MSGFFQGTTFRKSIRDADPTNAYTGTKSMAGSGTGYGYLTGIVRDFIGEPDVYINARKGKLINVVNKEDYEIMTKNSLIAYIIDDSEALKGKPPVICYPFFPHLSLPIKPGEHVWLLKDEFFGRITYYWLSRKTGIKQTDDPNYTHAERFRLIESKLNENNANVSNQPGSLFNQIDDLDKSAYTSFDNPVAINLPFGINNNVILNDSFAYRQEFTAEPVPPVRRKCGDSLLQGSNNAMLHLTTEKFQPSTLNKQAFTGQQTEPRLNGRYPLSPAIDLCVGRKKEELEQLKNTSGLDGSNGSVKITKGVRGEKYSDFESFEIDKLGNLLDQNSTFDTTLATDVNATNCGARLYLSNNCAIDETFGSSFDILDTLGGSSLATYADHNRIIADNSLRLSNRIGQSFLNMDSGGNVVIKSSINDGQQFLSLRNNGVSRLQARDKIEFAVSSDNDVDVNTVNEPYVLYSELAPFLKKVSGDVAFFNQIINLLMSVLQSFPPVAAIYQPLVQAREARDNGASAGMTVSIPEQEIEDKEGEILQTIPAYTLSIPAETLGDNINISNFVTEAQEVVDVLIKSTKIFGEANDKD